MFNAPVIHRNWAQLDEWTRNREPSIANQSKYIFKSIMFEFYHALIYLKNLEIDSITWAVF